MGEDTGAEHLERNDFILANQRKQSAEQDIINRVPELKKLNENIDKATNTCVNATLQCESVIQQYQRAEDKLGDAVDTISGKVVNINKHIDQVMEDAPKMLQLKVSVKLNDDDWRKIQELFDQERKWIIGKMQEHIHEVNTMFVEERMKAMNRYKEYDGCYLGHYAQWFVWFFFVLSFFVFTTTIVMMVGKWCNWF